MKIKQLKEKTIKGFIDFLPKVVVDNIEGLSNILNDKLSKSEGGEIKKPIVVTNDDSNYKTIINTDGSIYVFNKNTNNNVFSLINTNNGVIINNNVYAPIRINRIDALYDKHGNVLYNGTSNIFHANGFIINNGNNEQVLLGDGSTTGKLVKDIRVNQAGVNKKNTLMVMVQYIDGTSLGTELPKATIESAGVMTADDKAKLDDIENTYLPLSGGRMTGPLNINFTEGINIIEYDLNPRNTYIGNGSIKIEQLDGDSSRVVSKTEINSDSITTTNAKVANKIKANGFLANNKGNGHTAWTTNGESINLLNLLSNAAIYVEGDTVKINSALLIANETITDPDYIMFEENTGMFIALKNHSYFKDWNIREKRTIGNPIRYGTIIGTSVYPFHNQMYRFRNNTIVIANCSGDKPVFNKLTL